MLPYSQFDECIDFLTDSVDNLSLHNPNHTPLLGSPARIIDYYIKEFTAELEDKIANKNSREQKEDLLRLYLSRLMKSKNHISVQDIQPYSEIHIQAKDIIKDPSETRKEGGMLDMAILVNPSHELMFRRGCNILYHLIFDELQRTCVTFNIPFIRVCKELKFDLTTIHHEYSLKHEKGESSLAVERSSEIESQPILQSTSWPDNKTILTEIRESENKFWKGLPMNIVVDHFQVLTTKKSRNGEAFLSDAQLISFLRKGFLNDSTQPVQKFNCASLEKGKIIKTFYLFYNLALCQYSCPYTKESFIKLFTDCFSNWDPYSIPEFFVPNRVTKQL